jgi:hypothetical protein
MRGIQDLKERLMVKMVNSRNRLPIYDDTAVYDSWRILCNGYVKKAFICFIHKYVFTIKGI